MRAGESTESAHPPSSAEREPDASPNPIEAIAAINSQLEPQAVLDRVVLLARRLVNADAAAAEICDGGGTCTAARTGAGPARDFLEVLLRSPGSDPVGARPDTPPRLETDGLEKGDLDPSVDLHREVDLRASSRNDIGSPVIVGGLVSIPLVVNRSTSGRLLVADNGQDRAFSRAEIDDLISMASVAEVAVRNAMAFAARSWVTASHSTAVESSADAITISALDGSIVAWNHGCELLYGYSFPEVAGMSYDSLASPRRQPEIRELFGLALTGRGSPPTETVLMRADGSEVTVELTVSPVTASGIVSGVCLIARDLTARKAIEAELRARNSEIEQRNHELEQFTYIASHDLQEPLRMVVSYTELLSERYGDRFDERGQKYIRYAVDGGRRMQRLIRDLLSYSRVGVNLTDLNTVRLDELLDEVLLGLSPTIRAAGAVITRDPLPEVIGNYLQLSQVFQNLVSNAIKFRTDEAPEVVVAAETGPDSWKLKITDNGMGIPTAHADRVFQMFQRLHEASRFEGSGIGLAIVRRIVELHGGKVGFHPAASGGTTFWFTLPRRRPDRSDAGGNE